MGLERITNLEKKYIDDGGKNCKRCGEFKKLEEFSSLPNPPFYRAECKRCHNYKPARQFSVLKEKAIRDDVSFSINMDSFLEFSDSPCYYCDAEVNTIRLELINVSEGYTEGNMVSCCRNCKKFKGSMKHEEFIKLCHLISDNVRED